MARRLTERFPWLLPLRQKQRRFCFYLRMRFDGISYAARQIGEPLPYLAFESRCPMYNTETGFPMVYQENKVHNLKLAARPIDGLLLHPGETFSFWNRVHGADREIPYREALTERNGTLAVDYGGGLCQLSNLLCWICLHTSLTVTERHGHRKKDFPEPPSDAPLGVDAAVAEGWLDFRVRNNTDTVFQLSVTFDGENIVGRVYANRTQPRVRVVNRNLRYYREADGIYEEVDVVQQTGGQGERTVYRNRCRIAYPLPEGTQIMERSPS